MTARRHNGRGVAGDANTAQAAHRGRVVSAPWVRRGCAVQARQELDRELQAARSGEQRQGIMKRRRQNAQMSREERRREMRRRREMYRKKKGAPPGAGV